jgi:acyl-CoA thioesterase II
MSLSGGNANAGRSLLELLELQLIDDCVYRATYLFPDLYPLFGGQVIAQALRAAGRTVAPDRAPHSLHAYFLLPGDAAAPVDYKVSADRDGRSFSARRVVAHQNGATILTLSASFHVDEEAPPAQVTPMPVVARAAESEPFVIPRLFSYQGRLVDQVFPHRELVTRFWARCTADLGSDRLLNACAAAYLSDMSSGIAALDTSTHRSSASLDHSMWFHHPVIANDWLLMDLVPHVAARGRGWYTGSLFAGHGLLVASFAQEALYRSGTGSYFVYGP